MDNYHELANAIILQAVKDWREAHEHLRTHPHNHNDIEMIEDAESFFRSDGFVKLTSVDGEDLLKKLKEEVQ